MILSGDAGQILRTIPPLFIVIAWTETEEPTTYRKDVVGWAPLNYMEKDKLIRMVTQPGTEQGHKRTLDQLFEDLVDAGNSIHYSTEKSRTAAIAECTVVFDAAERTHITHVSDQMFNY